MTDTEQIQGSLRAAYQQAEALTTLLADLLMRTQGGQKTEETSRGTGPAFLGSND